MARHDRKWLLSRIGAVAIIVTMPVLIANCSRVAYATLNAPRTHLRELSALRRYSVLAHRVSVSRSMCMCHRAREAAPSSCSGTAARGHAVRRSGIASSAPRSRARDMSRCCPTIASTRRCAFRRSSRMARCALKWVHEHAHEWGGDPDGIFLMGHSAGAHLAATLALDARYLRKRGAADPLLGARMDRALGSVCDRSRRHASYRMLKVLFQAPYTAADWQITALAGDHAPPTLLLHGSADIFPEAVVDLDASLRAHGNYTECHVYERVGHVGTVAAFSLPLRWRRPH